MIAYLQSYLAGKATSYFVNAEADASDALMVIQHITHSRTNTKHDLERVKLMMQLWEDDPESLTIAAYSLYYHNGYTDHVYARAVARIIGFRLPLSQCYPNAAIQLTDFFLPWMEIFFHYPKKLHQYCDMHHAPLPEVSSRRIMEITKKMQEINIGVNLQTINKLEQGKVSPKTKTLKKISLQSQIPHIFLVSAKNTQKAAIFWDRIFIIVLLFFLKLRFRLKLFTN